jgi:hypothetical protein
MVSGTCVLHMLQKNLFMAIDKEGYKDADIGCHYKERGDNAKEVFSAGIDKVQQDKSHHQQDKTQEKEHIVEG